MAQNIQICVRIRPENSREHSPNLRQVVQALGEKTVVFDPPETDAFGNKKKAVFSSQNSKDLKFAFDHVFGPETSQLDIYKSTTATILDSVMGGFNCCVFAYGATGAGKTYTMLGAKEEPGVIFRTVMELYQKIELCEEYTYEIKVSYLEIYNEILKDLLSPGGRIDLREDTEGKVAVTGVSIHNPTKADDLMEMLHKGNAERTQQKTLANSESSRSHAIFQIYLKARPKGGGTITTWKYSKFSLIDLAGSERGSVTTGAKQQREGSNINRSLLALGNVINALAERNKNPKVFVPYRDSKLTRLLKDSIGGACQTIMIANLSPSSLSYEDSYNTLKYANRAKNIKVVAVENVMEVQSHVKEYADIIEKLKKENTELRQELAERSKSADKLALKTAFDQAYTDFDTQCRAVFRARAALKKDVTGLEAEGQTNAIKLQQKRWYLDMIQGMGWQQELRGSLSAEISELEKEGEKLALKLKMKKEEVEESVGDAETLQKQIYNYIKDNRDTMDNNGPALLTQLWEYHLVKVQSYHSDHSVQALRAYAATCQRHLQQSNSIGASVVEQQCVLATEDENIPESTRDHIQSTLSSVCEGMLDRKRKGIMWSDTPFNLPSSALFPSPQLVQPHSPQLSFTPGKLQIGSTPQLNKLQRATFQDGMFVTPGPAKLISRLAAKATPVVMYLSPTAEESPHTEAPPLNLLERFNKIKARNTPCKAPPKAEVEEEGTGLNSTFTLDEPLGPPEEEEPPASEPPAPGPLHKVSLPVITLTAEEKLQVTTSPHTNSKIPELFKNSQSKVQTRSRAVERAGNKRKARVSMIPNPSNIPSRTTRGNLVTPFKPLKEEPMLPAHKKLPIRRVVHSSESEPQPAKSDKPAFRRVPLPSKSPLRTTIKSNSSIKKSVLKTPSRVRSKSPLKIKSPGGQRSQSK